MAWECKANRLEDDQGFTCYSFSSASNGTMLNRREAYRVIVNENIHARALNNIPWDAIIIDISSSGAYIQLDKKIEVGQQLSFCLCIDHHIIDIIATVIRREEISDGKYRYGTTIKCKDESKLLRYITNKEREELKRLKMMDIGKKKAVM